MFFHFQYNGKDIGGGCVISVTKAVFGSENDGNQNKSASQLKSSQTYSDEELRSLLPSDCLNHVDNFPLAILWNIYNPRDPSFGVEFLAELEVYVHTWSAFSDIPRPIFVRNLRDMVLFYLFDLLFIHFLRAQ